jgi:hypothetical protein
MISRVQTRYVALVLLFTFCQVIGTMCAVPDLLMAQETVLLIEDNMACPMDGTIMCPPSLTSSPERQTKHHLIMDGTQAPVLIGPATFPTILRVPTQWFWSSASSIVPISIASSSVLRI